MRETTKAEEFIKLVENTVLVSNDDFKDLLTRSRTTDKRVSKLASDSLYRTVDEALANEFDVVIHNTFCYKSVLNRTIKYFKNRANLYFIDCLGTLTLEQLVERDLKRVNKVGEKVITNFYTEYLKWRDKFSFEPILVPKVKEVVPIEVVQNTDLEKCVLFDVDGTLAKMGDRSPFEWMKVHLDTPHEHVVNMTKMYKQAGYKVFILSGRDSVCRELTLAWLTSAGVEFDNLFMRPVNDYRADYTIKFEIYKTEIEGKYYVEQIFDDRKQVIELWQWLGLNCSQVAKSCDEKPFDIDRLFRETTLQID